MPFVQLQAADGRAQQQAAAQCSGSVPTRAGLSTTVHIPPHAAHQQTNRRSSAAQNS